MHVQFQRFEIRFQRCKSNGCDITVGKIRISSGDPFPASSKVRIVNQAFKVVCPSERTSPAIFASPHSGRDYPDRFVAQSQLSEKALRSSEDAFVDLLFGSAPEFGCPLLCALSPRAFVDVNRCPSDLDPEVVSGVSKPGRKPRTRQGLGIIPRVVGDGRLIYRKKIRLAEAERRIERIYRPYHEQLSRLLDESIELFGQAILFDCHSMPSKAISDISFEYGMKPDIVLGDLYGASCCELISEEAHEIFTAAGFRVAMNTPYAGAFVAENYGSPSLNRQVLQIEIDRSIYMDEKSIRPSGNFRSVQQAIRLAVRRLARIGRRKLRLAAE